MSKLQQKPLKREHPAPQNMKYLTFFLFLRVFLPSGSGSSRPKSMRIRNTAFADNIAAVTAPRTLTSSQPLINSQPTS